jgi:hypothetical protein
MALLYQAVAVGFRYAAAIRTDEVLEPLRERSDFRLLLMDLAMPAEPFARAH